IYIRYKDMISALSWIPRGASKAIPQKYDPSQDEDMMRAEGIDKLELEDELRDADQDEDEENSEQQEEEDNEEQEEEEDEEKDQDKEFNDRYNMDDYDEDEEEQGQDEDTGLKFINKAMKGLMYYKTGDEDPYLNEQDEDIEDLEDFIIRPTDAILIAAVANDEDDFSHLDVMVYEEDCDNLYVHHDIILGSFPISLAWMDQSPIGGAEKGSFVAIGTFEPAIEIWDLDLVDNLIPTAILGQSEVDKGQRK
ncbi:hypothetical protein SAMD00019534_007460, partial [Acytostelium subglobosum LB1]